VDVPRTKPRRNRVGLIAGAATVVVLGGLGLSRLPAASPSTERSTLVIDRVVRGDMLREVRGSGSLVPEDLRVVSAMTAGRIDRVRVRPGTRVDSTTVLIEMSNPDVQLQALDAERQVTLAEADLAALEASLDAQRLGSVTSTAAARTEANEAERARTVAERLQAEGLTSGMDVERARDRDAEAKERLASEREKLDVLTKSLAAQLTLRRAEVDRLRAIARFQAERVASMTVRAGQAGVLQSLALEPGQWVNPGQELARVAGQERLKAVVRVPELDARDLVLQLRCVVDTRNGKVAGHVTRVDPASQNGEVGVDIGLDGPLPRGARPDLAVDALIEIERLHDVLHIGRPADGSSEGVASLFVLDPGGGAATRRAVRLGRGSANAVEVLSGLKAGEEVILSEMTRWDQTRHIRLR
jgi:multidrug efflux pump subunit AcrA (membrane-fusion protein)